MEARSSEYRLAICSGCCRRLRPGQGIEDRADTRCGSAPAAYFRDADGPPEHSEDRCRVACGRPCPYQGVIDGDGAVWLGRIASVHHCEHEQGMRDIVLLTGYFPPYLSYVSRTLRATAWFSCASRRATGRRNCTISPRVIQTANLPRVGESTSLWTVLTARPRAQHTLAY